MLEICLNHRVTITLEQISPELLCFSILYCINKVVAHRANATPNTE